MLGRLGKHVDPHKMGTSKERNNGERKNKSHKYPVFIAELFIIARKWKQPECPQTEMKGKEDVVHIYNGILLSHKRTKIMPFSASLMDLEIIILSKARQRKTNIT